MTELRSYVSQSIGLSPSELGELRIYVVGKYMVVAGLTISVWDWLLHLADEVEMVQKGTQSGRWLGVALNTVYVVTRLSTVSLLAIQITISTVQFESCRGMAVAIAILNAVTVPASAILLLFRASAVYLHSLLSLTIFGSTWLALQGIFTYNSYFIAVNIEHVDGSNFCGTTKHINSTVFIATACFDTLVYLAISWRLSSMSRTGDTWKDRLRCFFTGSGLLGFSKSLLRGGQKYYFSTVGFNIFTGILSQSPGLYIYWMAQFPSTGTAVVAVMACQVFRELKLGVLHDSWTLPTLTTASFRRPSVAQITVTSIHLHSDVEMVSMLKDTNTHDTSIT